MSNRPRVDHRGAMQGYRKFTAEKLHFILVYYIKYRLGRADESEEV